MRCSALPLQSAEIALLLTHGAQCRLRLGCAEPLALSAKPLRGPAVLPSERIEGPLCPGSEGPRIAGEALILRPLRRTHGTRGIAQVPELRHRIVARYPRVVGGGVRVLLRLLLGALERALGLALQPCCICTELGAELAKILGLPLTEGVGLCP